MSSASVQKESGEGLGLAQRRPLKIPCALFWLRPWACPLSLPSSYPAKALGRKQRGLNSFPLGVLSSFSPLCESVSVSSGSTAAASLNLGHYLFLFHPPVLEPDGDLSLWKVGGCRDLSPLVLGDELAVGIFLLQLFQLTFAVRNPLLATTSEGTALSRVLAHGFCFPARERNRRAN